MSATTNWVKNHFQWADLRSSCATKTDDKMANPYSGAVVLVNDDDPMQRLMARDALEEVGFIVKEAEDGPEGIAMAFDVKPDLIILDLMMPKLDGFSVCREVRRIKATRHIPILISTGNDDTAAIQRALHVGATDFLLKPITWKFLGLRVQYILRNFKIVDVGEPLWSDVTSTGTSATPEPNFFVSVLRSVGLSWLNHIARAATRRSC